MGLAGRGVATRCRFGDGHFCQRTTRATMLHGQAAPCAVAFGISRPPVAVRRTLVMRSKLTALSLRVQTLSCAHWGLIGMGALSFVGAGKQPPEAKKPVGSRAGGIPKPIMDAMNLRAVNVASERLPSLLREWKKRATHLAVFDA